MNFQIAFLGISLLIQAFFTAAPLLAAEDPCSSHETLTIQRPAGQDLKFPYKFRFLKGGNVNSPVVIYLPGGPGQSSISLRDPRFFEDYGFVQTDPRGAGCNDSYWSIPGADVNTEILADDIIAIVDHLKLKKFILFGTSFGTALATIVSHRLEIEGKPTPMALVLQGVVGRAFKKGESELGYIKEWEIQSKDLEPSVKSSLSGDILPYGFTGWQWATWIDETLLFGRNRLYNQYEVIQDLNALNSQPDYLRASINSANEKPPASMIEVYKRIGCREFADGWATDPFLNHGKLESRDLPVDICSGIALSSPFNSRDYQSKTVIYYFNGTDDPATPMWQADYHFDSQREATRVVVNIPGGGHNSLKVNLDDCNFGIWADILDGKTELGRTLSLCKLNPSISVSLPN